MVDSFKVHNFHQNILALEAAKGKKILWKQEYVKGQLQEVKGFLKIAKANVVYCFFFIIDLTFRTHLVESIEKSTYRRIFRECTAFLTDKELARIDPTKISLSIDEQTTVEKVKKEWSVYLLSTLSKQFPFEISSLISELTSLERCSTLKEPLSTDQILSAKSHFLTVYHCLETKEPLEKIYKELLSANHPLPTESRDLSKLELLQFLIGTPKIKTYLDDVLALHETFRNPDTYLANFAALHAEFVADGTHVDIVDGQLMPTQAQLKKAFKLVLEKHFSDLPPPTTSCSRILLARLVQYVMCGDRLKTLPMPKNDICFTCKEMMQLNEILPIKESDTALEWYLKNSANYTALIASGKTEKESLSEQIKFYLTQFWKDADRLLPSAAGDRQPVDPKIAENFGLLCADIKEDFHKLLLTPEKNIKTMAEALPAFYTALGLPPNFDANTFNTLCAKALPESRDLTPLFELMQKSMYISNSQQKALKAQYEKQNGPVSEAVFAKQLNALIRFHFLKFMILNQQTSMGIQADQIETFKTLTLPQDRIRTALKLDELTPGPTNQTKQEYRFCAEEFLAKREWRFGVMQEQASKLNIPPMRSDVYYFMELDRVFKASWGPVSSPRAAHSSLMNFGHVRVSPHTHPFLDTLISSLKPQH